MVTAEGIYPKTGGDPIYASERNNLIGTVAEEEAGPYTHTGDTSLTTVRTYTVGGISGKGYKLAVVTFEAFGDTGGGIDYHYLIHRGSETVNAANVSGVFTAISQNTATSIVSAMIPIDNADTIVIKVQTSNGAAVVAIKNVKIWCQDARATFAGS